MYALYVCVAGYVTWPYVSMGCLLLALISLSFLTFTVARPQLYRQHASVLAMATLFLVAGFSLAPFLHPPGEYELEESHSFSVGEFRDPALPLALEERLFIEFID